MLEDSLPTPMLLVGLELPHPASSTRIKIPASGIAVVLVGIEADPFGVSPRSAQALAGALVVVYANYMANQP